jgi:uncharacterized membrane protein (UPF0127 family)
MQVSNTLLGPMFKQMMLVFGLLLASASFAQDKEDIPEILFGKVAITVNDKPFELEYAHNFDQRARGLMYRKSMCEDCGMLFEFEYSRKAGFWMKNTLIPLDIAYIDREGVITDIKPMHPLVLESVPSSRAVMFAWEMNQGWFAKNQISEGDKIKIVERTKVN